jgi:hypothetical protein
MGFGFTTKVLEWENKVLKKMIYLNFNTKRAVPLCVKKKKQLSESSCWIT